MEKETTKSSLDAPTCSARIADSVTVGELLQLIRKKHISALAQRKPDYDMARAMRRLELNVESALEFHRICRPNRQNPATD